MNVGADQCPSAQRASNPCSRAALSPRDRDNSAQHRVILSFLVATLKEKLKEIIKLT